jgi:TIR domain-containing protein
MAKSKSVTPVKRTCSMRFESAQLDSLFAVLDAVAWLANPTMFQIAQFAGIDPRTAGKLVKNSITIGLVEAINGEHYSLLLAYPYKGSLQQKRAVVREALVRMPLLESMRQFLSLGDKIDDALRKAATVCKVDNFDPKALAPLIQWAQNLDALKPRLLIEDLLNIASDEKEKRHTENKQKRVVFLSHSSKDKPIIRQLAADLTAEGVTVWLDEQKIKVGDSIPDQIAQGLVESDYFIIALSNNSVNSAWVKKELNSALVQEIKKRRVVILPIQIGECEIPTIISDKKIADFTKSYKDGLQEILNAIKSTFEEKRDE